MASLGANPKGRNNSRRLLYKVKSTTASDGTLLYSIFSCIDDVEHHRHRRNPFDPKYIQAALSSFEELGKDSHETVATREEVEAASTSVHVRTELIKSMKDGLVKLTSEAVKHCKGAAKKAQKNRPFLEERLHVREQANKQNKQQQDGGQPYNFLRQDDYEIFQKKFGGVLGVLESKRQPSGLIAKGLDNSSAKGSIYLGLAQTIREMESCLTDNSNFVSEDELCFNLNKETMETVHNVLQRKHPDAKLGSMNEDIYADLSPYKCFISPITKDLILDFEDSQDFNQCGEKMEEFTSQTEVSIHSGENIEKLISRMETETLDCDEDFEVVEMSSEVQNDVCPATSTGLEEKALSRSHQTVANLIVNAPPAPGVPKTTDQFDKQNHMPVIPSYVESDEISSSGSMEISFEDESMEDNICQEEIQDDIEDSEMDAGTGVYFSIEDLDIDRCLSLRRQLKRSRSLWLVQDPEKLLFPYTDTADHMQAPLNKESNVPSCVPSGKMFKEALSRPGMDIIEHYNLLQEDPLKIAGALQFDLPTSEWESVDMASTPSRDITVEGMPERNQNMDTSASVYTHSDATEGDYEAPVGARTTQFSSLQELNNTTLQRGIPSFCPVDLAMAEEVCWDNFSWPTKLMQRSPTLEPFHSAEINLRHDTAMKQSNEGIVEKGNLASARFSPLYGRGDSYGSKSMLRSPTCDIGDNTCIKESNEDIIENSNSASDRFSPLYGRRNACAHESTAWDPCCSSAGVPYIMQVTSATRMQTTSPLSDSIASSRVVNPAEGTPRDDVFSNIVTKTATHTEESTHSCLSSEPAPLQHFLLDGVDEQRKDSGCQVEGGPGQKKRFLLDDLITGAVMAECQLHKRTFSHFDLEPLSRVLCGCIAAFSEAQKAKAIVFKDLVDSCIQAEGDKLSGSITLQRYFIALVSAVHQQNMGIWKDKRMEGLQILLQEGNTGKLSDITINLTPSGLV